MLAKVTTLHSDTRVKTIPVINWSSINYMFKFIVYKKEYLYFIALYQF